MLTFPYRTVSQVDIPHLSPREEELVLHLGRWASTSEIAAAMGLTDGTVKQYLFFITRRTGLNRLQLATWGQRMLEAMAS